MLSSANQADMKAQVPMCVARHRRELQRRVGYNRPTPECAKRRQVGVRSATPSELTPGNDDAEGPRVANPSHVQRSGRAQIRSHRALGVIPDCKDANRGPRTLCTGSLVGAVRHTQQLHRLGRFVGIGRRGMAKYNLAMPNWGGGIGADLPLSCYVEC